MPSVTQDSWRVLPTRSDVFAELIAEAVTGVDGAYLAVDHEGTRHLLLVADQAVERLADERSRGIRVLTRPLSVQGQPERVFIDVMCSTSGGQDVFNLVASAVIEQIELGALPAEATRSTLGRWRRFWSAVPPSGLTAEEIVGLFGELWFLAVWLIPHNVRQVKHWLGPTGIRHDFAWSGTAIEAKATTSTRGHIHRINGIEQLDPPESGELFLFSLRMREEPTAANSLVTLVQSISRRLATDAECLDSFESRLAQAGYSPLDADRYGDVRFRVVGEHLYKVCNGFPRLTATSFTDGRMPAGVDRIEYEVNLDSCSEFLAARSPEDFTPPSAAGTATLSGE